MNDSNLLKFDELYQFLEDIKNQSNLEGIIFAHRDGGLIIENLDKEFDSKNFTSMCASVLESAVGSGETIGEQEVGKIIAEIAEKTILIFKCDIKTFLILIVKRESNANLILEKLNEIIQKVVKMYLYLI
ncbi:MAG: hypothetical protein ACFE91_12000 [Promethearchaeota archaeon]